MQSDKEWLEDLAKEYKFPEPSNNLRDRILKQAAKSESQGSLDSEEINIIFFFQRRFILTAAIIFMLGGYSGFLNSNSSQSKNYTTSYFIGAGTLAASKIAINGNTE